MAVEVFHCLPDELIQRLDAFGPDGASFAVTELMAYYQIQKENRDQKEWERAINKNAEKTQRLR